MTDNINPDPATDQDPTHISSPDCDTCKFRKKFMADAEKETSQPRTGKSLFSEVRALNISSAAKADLLLLCARAKNLGRKILRFLARNRHLGEAVVLGCLVYTLMSFLPIIGNFFGLIALSLIVSVGVLRELQASISALFAADMPVYA